MDRAICNVDGCNKTVMSLGHNKFAKQCRKHYKLRFNMNPFVNSKQRKKLHIPNKECIICGWDKGPCDRHRIKYGVNGGQYTIENVVSLCPNCHRLLHLNLITIK